MEWFVPALLRRLKLPPRVARLENTAEIVSPHCPAQNSLCVRAVFSRSQTQSVLFPSQGLQKVKLTGERWCVSHKKCVKAARAVVERTLAFRCGDTVCVQLSLLNF